MTNTLFGSTWLFDAYMSIPFVALHLAILEGFLANLHVYDVLEISTLVMLFFVFTEHKLLIRTIVQA